MRPQPTIDELLLGDDDGRWSELSFTVANRCCELGGVRLRFLGHSAGTGVLGWTLRDLAVTDTELDGLPTTVSEQPPRPLAPAHPNGVVAIDHLVAFSPSLDRTVDALRRAGLELRRIREQPTPAGAPRQAFFRLGAEILEVVQQPSDSIGRPARQGDPSIERPDGQGDPSTKRPAGQGDPSTERPDGRNDPARFWGLAVLVEDLDRTVQLLGSHASPIRPAVQPGRRIATLRRSAGLTVPMALMSGPA